MSNKSKGSKAERELYEIFLKNNFRAVRVAGSGKMEKSDCDLIAGKPGKKYALEVKSTKKSSKYISKEQMENFLIFSEIFGLSPVIAIRFNRLGWYFFNPHELEDSGKNWVISQEIAKSKGKRFSQFFEEPLTNNKNPDLELLDEIYTSEEVDKLKENNVT
ncbi:MAG: Holliday junction resolvase Hjc [Candidatus Pacearchaeota archaeon]